MQKVNVVRSYKNSHRRCQIYMHIKYRLTVFKDCAIGDSKFVYKFNIKYIKYNFTVNACTLNLMYMFY